MMTRTKWLKQIKLLHIIGGNLPFNGANLQGYGLNNFLEKLIAMILAFSFILNFHKLIKYKSHLF